MEQVQVTIACAGCKKRFFEAGFKVNRLGQRLKTCLECNVRDRAKRERSKCQHGRQRRLCRECEGYAAGICEHDRERHCCKVCNPDKCRRKNELAKFRTYQREGGWPIMPLVRKSTRDQCDYVAAKLARDFAKLLDENRVTKAEYDALMALRRDWTGPVEGDDPKNMMTPFERWGIPHGPSVIYAPQVTAASAYASDVNRAAWPLRCCLADPSTYSAKNRVTRWLCLSCRAGWEATWDAIRENPAARCPSCVAKGPTLTDDELAEILGFAL